MTNKERWSIYIDKELLDRVKLEAKKQDRSFNYVLEQLIKEFINGKANR